MNRLDKQKLERLRVGLIDIDYTIKRLDRDGASDSERANWLSHKNDVLNLINKLQGAKND